jgi:deazaflavin-dependent oxidoreductase (nitroreductase family)
MDERAALGRSRQVGVLTFAIGAVLLRWPRLGRVADLEARDSRLIALLDLAVAPGLIWGRPRRPWLFARAAANVGIAAILLRRRSRAGRAIAAGFGVATASDFHLAAALGEGAEGGAASGASADATPAGSSGDTGPGRGSLNARLNLAVGDLLNDRGIYLGRRSTKVHVAIYRRSGGRVGGVAPGWPEARIALVDHRGAKSGTLRTSPLVYRADGKSLAIIASKAGQPSHPSWFHNLMANPETTVQIGRETRPVRARLASGAESERFWPQFIAAYPSYATYRERARPREIPIVILEPRG